MRKIFFMLILLFSASVLADQSTLTICDIKHCPYKIVHKDSEVIFSQNRNGLKISIKNSSGKMVSTSDTDSIYVSQKAKVIWLSSNLAEIFDPIHIDATSDYDNHFFFLDFKKMRISGMFHDVYAVETNKKIIAYLCTDEGNNVSTVKVSTIFSPHKRQIISRDFGGDSYLSVNPFPSTYFMKNGDLNLSYISKSGKNIKESVPINYRKLGIN